MIPQLEYNKILNLLNYLIILHIKFYQASTTCIQSHHHAIVIVCASSTNYRGGSSI